MQSSVNQLHRWFSWSPRLIVVLFALALVPALAQEPVPADGGQPADESQPATDDPATTTDTPTESTALGRFIEVIVTTKGLAAFEGWVRENARVEIFDRNKNGYIQLKNTRSNRDIDGAGLRLYYVDRMQGFTFIKFENIEEIEEVREISQEEEDLWQKELERQIQERRELFLKKQEEEARLAEEEAARLAEEEAIAASEGVGDEEPMLAVPAELEKGYKMLDEFPEPEWGEEKYKVLRRMQLTERKKLTIDEQRFVESYISDWKPALDHKLANAK